MTDISSTPIAFKHPAWISRGLIVIALLAVVAGVAVPKDTAGGNPPSATQLAQLAQTRADVHAGFARAQGSHV